MKYINMYHGNDIFYIRGLVLRKALSWVSDNHLDSWISGNIHYFFDLLYEVHQIYLISRITVTLHDHHRSPLDSPNKGSVMRKAFARHEVTVTNVWQSYSLAPAHKLLRNNIWTLVNEQDMVMNW